MKLTEKNLSASALKALLLLGLGMLFWSGCSEMLDVEVPGDQLKEDEAVTSKQDVEEILNSCYDVNANLFSGRVQYCNELLSDNLALQNNSGDLGQIFTHNVSIFNGTITGIYGDPYITVFRANRILELLQDFDFTEAEKRRIRAEVLFLRALSHWEVLKLWAQPYGFTPNNGHPGVVYKTSTEVQVLARGSVAEGYTAVINDLEEALNLGSLPAQASYQASEDAVKALLAEVYFQQGEYMLASDMAQEVIAGGRYRLDTIIDRFQADTAEVPEVIFKTRSYAPRNDFRSGGFTGNYRSDIPQPPFFRASEEFFQIYSRDTLDRRVQEFFELRNPGTPDEFVAVKKFNKVYFDVPIFHLTKLKLIRAEAEILANGDVNTAIGDVNDLRERAYGNDTLNLPLNSPAPSVLDAVRKERRLELFGEGDRIQQLKRRGALENENIIIRDDVWNCPGMILQFPSTERTEAFEINPQGGC